MDKFNQILQTKYPHLEVSVSPLSKVKKHLILGSDFNSNTREEALSNIKSEYKVSDYFDLINATISQIQEPYYVYDLTHSLGNFLQDVELTQNKLGSNKKQVKKDDLIISRLRSYLQEIAVVQQKDFKQLVSTEYLVYRPKTKLMSSNTLMVFALTKSVQTVLNYSQYGTEHPRFYEFVFDEMPIPKAVLELNYHIDSMMKEAYKAIESSKFLYKEAEALLYEALGLDSKNPLQSILNVNCKHTHSICAKDSMIPPPCAEGVRGWAKTTLQERADIESRTIKWEKENTHDTDKPKHRYLAPYMKEFSRELRKNPTKAESILWQELRNKKLGVRFRRQFVIDSKYIADFVCLKARLIIECDGGQHNQGFKDRERDFYLQSHNFRILRFWNNEILENLQGVLVKITEVLRECLESKENLDSSDTHPLTPSAEGGGTMMESSAQGGRILLEQSPNYTIATLKESFLKTGRLDAEYYQSKYEDIERFIKSYGYITLQDSEIQDKNYTPKQEKQYHYIELANIGSNGNISTPTQDFGKNLPTRARRIVKEGDVIISSVEGSLSSCALITKEFDSCLVSTGFYVLRSKHINGETLLVLFKSEIFQDYLKKFPSGTILSAISKEELQNILIPKIDSTTQTQIATHIQKSFELRAEAKSLLESAKAKVESALNDTNNGGGGVNNTLYLQILRIYLPQIKAKLKESKRFYRLARWLLIETLCFRDILDSKNKESIQKQGLQNYTIRTLAKSLKESGRLDAEYYQSKYEKNEALLKNYKYGFCKLKDLIQTQSSGFAFSSDEYVEYSDLALIRINNIKNATLDMSNAVYLKNEAQNLSPKDKVHKGDILISMSGSIGMSCVVRDDINAMLNQRIYKIAIRGFSSDVLVVFLNSVCAKLQFERIGTGGVQTNISSSDIQKLLIPLLDSKTQAKIESKITQSFALRVRSKELLESAKQRVENAVYVVY